VLSLVNILQSDAEAGKRFWATKTKLNAGDAHGRGSPQVTQGEQTLLSAWLWPKQGHDWPMSQGKSDYILQTPPHHRLKIILKPAFRGLELRCFYLVIAADGQSLTLALEKSRKTTFRLQKKKSVFGSRTFPTTFSWLQRALRSF
jgi:hypothetical protein